MSKKKTFFYFIQVKNRGRTNARLFRVQQKNGRAHVPEFVNLVPFDMSRPPKRDIHRAIVEKWLKEHGHVQIGAVEGKDFYLEDV